MKYIIRGGYETEVFMKDLTNLWKELEIIGF